MWPGRTAGKHLQLRRRANGNERMYSLPVTPSDIRSINTRAAIRRLLREDCGDNGGAKTSSTKSTRSIAVQSDALPPQKRLALLEQKLCS